MIASCLEGFAELSLSDGQVERAGRLLGASDASLDELGRAPSGRRGDSRTRVVNVVFATADRRRTFCHMLPPIENGDPGDESAEE